MSRGPSFPGAAEQLGATEPVAFQMLGAMAGIASGNTVSHNTGAMNGLASPRWRNRIKRQVTFAPMRPTVAAGTSGCAPK